MHTLAPDLQPYRRIVVAKEGGVVIEDSLLIRSYIEGPFLDLALKLRAIEFLLVDLSKVIIKLLNFPADDPSPTLPASLRFPRLVPAPISSSYYSRDL